MIKLSKRATLALAATGAVAVGGGVTAAFAAGGSSAPDTTPQPDVAHAVSSALSDRYAVFKQPADPIPGNSDAAAEYGQNGELARALGDTGYYVVPGKDDSICLVTAVGGGICRRAGDSNQPTTLTSAMCLDGRQVLHFVGLFSDDVTTVNVTGTGTTGDQSVAVKSNAVRIDLPAENKSTPTLTWSGADGEHTLPLTIPSGAGRMFCGDRTP